MVYEGADCSCVASLEMRFALAHVEKLERGLRIEFAISWIEGRGRRKEVLRR